VLHDGSARALPHDAVARYHAFAQQHLAAAVAGEQAGSMALYGLGRIHIRMAETTDDDLQSVRKSMTMYQAALAAHPGNHLAANELGVLLAQGGHHVDAVAMLQRAIRIAPTATAFQNLAVVQRKLGDQRQAAASDTEAARLAHWERSVGAVSRRLGVEWVSPEHMARMSTPSERPAPQLAASPQGPRPSAAPQPPKTASKLRWPWQRGEEQTPTPGPTRRVARRPQPTSSGTPQRPQMDPIQSNTVWR
jgi:tetratricopeptide (TPR) repeat protein